MKNPDRHIVVFYDDPCIDGEFSAFVFHKKYGTNPNVRLTLAPLQHGDPDVHHKTVMNHIAPGSNIYFVDTAPTERELLDIVFRGVAGSKEAPVQSVAVWDHHESEEQWLRNFSPDTADGREILLPELNIDLTKPSAAQLTWSLLHPNVDPPPILDFIGQIEKWKFKDPTDKVIAVYVDEFLLARRGNPVKRLEALTLKSADELKDDGVEAYPIAVKRMEPLRAQVVYTVLDLSPGMNAHIVPLLHVRNHDYGHIIEDLFQEVAEEKSADKMMMAWHVKGDGSVKMNIRSFGDIHAGQVAKFLKYKFSQAGGGHADKAALEFKNKLAFDRFVPIFNTHAAAAKAAAAIHHSRWEFSPR